ncbi:MAG: ECF transporter S component [Bacilli bacterium]|nr:ECF transporter S component [Bacilli bacterium]
MDSKTKKMVTLGILSALGAILMIIEIPYPFVPFLMIDLSDVVILVVFAFYGWREAALVGLLKTVIHALTKGAVGPIYIGQITAFIASMSYVLGMYISTNKLNLNRLFSAVFSVLVVTTILTVGNYYFITPIWFGELTFLDIKDWVTPETFGLNLSGGYLFTILMIYVPFNLLKGAIVTSVYFLVYKSIHYLKPVN